MRTMEEMMQAIHNRASELQGKREKQRLIVTGISSVVLGLALVTLIGTMGGFRHIFLQENYTSA